MKSELETLVSINTSETLSEEAAREINSLLRSGIEAAKNGKRDEAKALLFRVTDIEPANEMAWLWLASVSEYPEELLTFLQKVLTLNPQNEQALEWEKSTKALLARNLVQYGITAVQENKKESAKRCFLRALETDENNEMAWLWMASITDEPEEKVSHLKRVLAINPENDVANTLLKLLQKDEAQELLQRSKASAVHGNRTEALEMLEQVKQLDSELDEVWILQAHLSESFEEKAFCFNQALACNPNNEAAKFGLASLQSILQAVNGNTVVEEYQPEPEEQIAFSEPEEQLAFNEDILVEDSEEVMETTFAAEMPEIAEAAEVDQMDEADETFSSAADAPPSQGIEEMNEQPFFTDEAEVDEMLFAAQDNFETQEPEAEFTASEEAEPSVFAEEFVQEEEPAAAEAPEAHETEAEPAYAGNGLGSHPVEFSEAHTFESSETEISDLSGLEEAASFEEEEMKPAAEGEIAVYGEEEIKAQTIYFGHEPEKATEIFQAEDVETGEFSENFSVSEETAPTQEFTEEPTAFEPAEETAEEIKAFMQGSSCPFCSAENNINDEVCNDCQAVLGLHNMDMLLSRQETDEEKLSAAVERMEAKLESDDSFSAEEYFNLGLACLNLKEMDPGLKYLQKSYILNPTNSFLKAQIDELAKRMGKDEKSEENGNGSGVGSKTIMVVDDSATIRKLVSAKLEKHGHKVVMAVDGMDALAKLEEAVPDLILLDITMPRLDGYQVCKLIRANDNTRFVPVVLISGKDGFFDKVRGKMCGSTTYITKPFGPEMLLRTVESYFQ